MNEKKYVDLTEFWLEWREKCAIDLCSSKQKSDAINMLDGYFICVLKNANVKYGLDEGKKKRNAEDENGKEERASSEQHRWGDIEDSEKEAVRSSSSRKIRLFAEFSGYHPATRCGVVATKFREEPKIRDAKVSEYIDFIDSCNRGYVCGTNEEGLENLHPLHPYVLLESYLYNKQTICGRPFKDHLFEKAKLLGEPVGEYLSKYVLNCLRTIINSSFGSGSHATPIIAISREDPTRPHPVDTLTLQDLENAGIANPFFTPEEEIEIQDAADQFLKQMEGKWETFDKANKVIFFLEFFNKSLNAPDVKELVGNLSSSAVSKRSIEKVQTIAFLQTFVRYLKEEGYTDAMCRRIIQDDVQKVVLKVAEADPECKDLLLYFEKIRMESGKNTRRNP